MADEDTPSSAQFPAAIPQDGQLERPLQQAQASFSTDDGRAWASDILATIQQHLNAVHIANANSAAGQHFEQTVSDTKDNLVGMAKADPTSAQLAIDLAPKLLAPVIAGAGLSPEDEANTHAQISEHVQGAVANAAVTRMADLHAGAARSLMDSLADYIPDEAKFPLRSYINTLDAARQADQAATQSQTLSQAARASSQAAYKYGSTLFDPRTEEISFPPGYLEKLVRNQQILPSDKEPLFKAFGQLQPVSYTHLTLPTICSV